MRRQPKAKPKVPSAWQVARTWGWGRFKGRIGSLINGRMVQLGGRAASLYTTDVTRVGRVAALRNAYNRPLVDTKLPNVPMPKGGKLFLVIRPHLFRLSGYKLLHSSIRPREREPLKDVGDNVVAPIHGQIEIDTEARTVTLHDVDDEGKYRPRFTWPVDEKGLIGEGDFAGGAPEEH